MYRSSEDFIELLKPIYSDAVNYCIALTRHDAEAKDLLQDALLKALENFDSLRDEKKFKSWLFTILTRKYYAMYQKSIIRKNYLKRASDETIEFPQLFENETTELNQKILLQALDHLSEKERTAIVLFEIGNFSLEDIRNIQGEKSLSAVKSRLSRSRDKLRAWIKQI